MVGVLRLRRGRARTRVVLLIPGLDSTKEEFRSTEKTFLDRGHGDVQRRRTGPGRGGVRPADPRRLGRRAPRPRRLAAQPEVDRDRLAVWGVSLGGYYAPRVAAALGDRVAGLRRAGRPVQLRRLLGPACRS